MNPYLRKVVSNAVICPLSPENVQVNSKVRKVASEANPGSLWEVAVRSTPGVLARSLWLRPFWAHSEEVRRLAARNLGFGSQVLHYRLYSVCRSKEKAVSFVAYQINNPLLLFEKIDPVDKLWVQLVFLESLSNGARLKWMACWHSPRPWLQSTHCLRVLRWEGKARIRISV
jgi:hypothetical protein